MSEPIKKGDLVMFVHSCCIEFRDGVNIFTVNSIRPSRPADICSFCRKPLPHDRYASDNPQYAGAPMSWLKRIPPLSELGDVEHKEEIPA